MHKMLEQNMRPEFIVDDITREMFQYALDYYTRAGFRKAVTLELLRDDFPQWFQSRRLPDEEYLIDKLIDKAKERHRRNNGQNVIRDVGYKLTEDTSEAVSEAISRFTKINIETTPRNRQEVFSQEFDTVLSQYYKNRDDDTRGIYFGWDEVDALMYGIQPSEFVTVGGFTGTGKSFAMNKISIEAAKRGYVVYLASLENSRMLTKMRLVCILTGVPFDLLQRGQLADFQEKQLEEGRYLLDKMDNLIIDSPMKRSERYVGDFYNRASYMGCDLLVGDQLSWITPESTYGGNQTQQMEERVSSIADFSKSFNIASVWASQLNRESEKKKSTKEGFRRPTLDNFSHSSMIEQISDYVVTLSASEEMRRENMLILEILKSRRGERKAWLMDWRLATETHLEVNREYKE